MPPWAPDRAAFLQLSVKAAQSVNQVLRRYIDGAELYVSDAPGMELVAEGVDPRALVLLDGIDERSKELRQASRVFIYALNIARLAGGVDMIEREVALAIEREISATFLEPEQGERPIRELN
jgi:hypothetical protein